MVLVGLAANARGPLRRSCRSWDLVAQDHPLLAGSRSPARYGRGGASWAVAMANGYPREPLLLHQWGCGDAPDFPPFNADPASLPGRVVTPGRIIVLPPGEPYTLQPLPG
jgi:hypothetical protein